MHRSGQKIFQCAEFPTGSPRFYFWDEPARLRPFIAVRQRGRNVPPRCNVPGTSPYLGRDLVHDKGFGDRISGIIGLGLQHPKDEFVAGIGFELLQGVNITGVYRMAKLHELDGVTVGQSFAEYSGLGRLLQPL